MIKVFYDGNCGLCRREINYYRRLVPLQRVEWINLLQDSTLFISLGYNVKEGLHVLHVLDQQGRMHTGVDAFIIIWRCLPYWRYRAVVANLPWLKPLIYFIYPRFAQWRFKKLKYHSCQL